MVHPDQAPIVLVRVERRARLADLHPQVRGARLAPENHVGSLIGVQEHLVQGDLVLQARQVHGVDQTNHPRGFVDAREPGQRNSVQSTVTTRASQPELGPRNPYSGPS